MESKENKIALPGDEICDLNSNVAGKIIAGPGLRREGDKIIATKCGIVRKQSSNNYYIDCHQKRYVPVRGEHVIGVVLKKSMEAAIVDIGSSEPATLSLLAFENATKRNKPTIKVGDIVYAQISVACKDMEPELVCINSYGKSAGMGILDDSGFLLQVSLEVSRKLLSPEMTILKRLGKTVPFEVAVGLNGRVWIRTKVTEHSLAIVHAINLIEHVSEKEAEDVLDQLFLISHELYRK